MPAGFYDAIAQSNRYDVVPNSWGSTPSYSAGQNLNTGEFSAQTVAGWNSAAATGRGGLGTIVVKSSGNERVCCSVAFTGDASGDSLKGSRTFGDPRQLTP